MVVVQLFSYVSFFVTPWTTACQASLSFTISWSLLKLMSHESVIPSNHLFLLLPPSSPALYLSQHQSLFQWVVSSHQVAKVLELEHQSFQWMFRVGKWGPWEIIRVEPSQMRWVRLKEEDMDFPGGPVVKTLPSNAGGVGLIRDQGAKVLHPSRTTTTNNRENRT